MAAHGVNELLVGATGTGKTYAIRTLVDAGITPFCLFTEPGFVSVLGDIPDDKLHWKYIAPASPDWATLIDSAMKINTMSFDAIAKLSNINKGKYAQYMDVLKELSNFTCDRCGKSYGSVDSWGPDRAIVVDSLSGINIMAMSLVVGSKPTRSMSDWGTAMNNLEWLIQKLCMDTKCHFVLTAHLEREIDEISGGVQLMASTLGKKLAPKIPRYFDDVIMCKREGTSFFWSTADLNVDLKARNLPIADRIPPSFVQVIDHWKKQQGGTDDVKQTA